MPVLLPQLGVKRTGARLRMTLTGLRKDPPRETGVILPRKKTASISAPVCIDIVNRLLAWNPELVVSDALASALAEQAARREYLQSLAALEDTGGNELLLPYQRVGSEWLLAIRRGILADPQGMGKTVEALDAVKALAPKRGLIVCGDRKRADWKAEVEKWSGVPSQMLTGDEDDRKQALAQWNGFLICNYKVAGICAEDLKKSDFVILDEAHKLRNRQAAMAKSLQKICRGDKPVFILTASPNVNKEVDSWVLLSICDPARFGSFWSFAFRFCDITHNGFGISIGGIKEDEEENLRVLLDEYVLSRSKDLLPDMPTQIPRVVLYEMPEEQRELYDQMRDTGIVTYGDHSVEAPVQVARITRKRQLALHPGLVFPTYRGPTKLDALSSVVREKPDKCVVFTHYSTLAGYAVPRLAMDGIEAVALTGSLTDAAGEAALDRFQRGSAQVLIATHGTGGEGLNLIEASRVIFLELAWHPVGNEHARDRIVRMGQLAKTVDVIVIHVVDSVEDDIWEIVADKVPVTIAELLRRGAR